MQTFDALDLNLLKTLDTLLRERSVTRAARALGLSQSALSHRLRNLREMFDDPLFVSFFDGTATTEIEAVIQDAARENAFLKNSLPEIVWHGFQAEGYALSEDRSHTAADAIAALDAAHRAVTGAVLDRLATTATTDARFFGLYADTPALVYGPRAQAIHGFNERVELESMRRVTQATALFIADWCGVEEI